MQIKIRAWDTVNKRMRSWEELLSGREFKAKLQDPKAHGTVLMMWTGLTDINGVDIYEGDILKGICFFLGYGASKTDAGDYWIENEVKYINGEFLCRGFDLHSLNSTTSIIGNIYENS